MKKLAIILLGLITLGLASCQKDNTVVQAPQNITIIRDISPNSWVLSNDRLTYSANLSISQIDKYHIDNEGTLVYISYNNGTSYSQLPFVYNVNAFSYEVYVGGISIDLQSSDYQASTPIRPTNTVRIKIVLISN